MRLRLPEGAYAPAIAELDRLPLQASPADKVVCATTAAKSLCACVMAHYGEDATPADAALMMQLGMDGVFVGSGIFKSGEPAKRARAIVQAVTHYNDPKILAEVSQGLGEAMVGIDCKEMHFTSYAARSE